MPADRASPGARLRRAGWIGAAVGFVPFLAVLWDFRLDPLRRSTATGTNSDFFDVQARALFHGHLDVPPGSLGIEAFVVGGRHYLYFPPFPALLRMPVLLVTDRLDGRLTAISMLAAWFVLAYALVTLLGVVRQTVRGDAPVGRFETVGSGAVVASVLGGSTLVFIASLPWVYHEVYMWSAALSVATLAGLVTVWRDRRRRDVASTVVLAIATMLTRAPAGWAMAFTLIAIGLVLGFRRREPPTSEPGAHATGWWLVAGGMASIVLGSAINWAKFRHPYLFPIENQVWSQMSAHRKVVLALNHGRLDGWHFVWTNITAYLRPDGLRFVPYFPFVTPPAHPPTAVGGVVFDESFRTASVPALMPLLFVLALWGLVSSWFPGRAALRAPILGALASTAGVMAFGYIAQRYTAEFVPFLAIGALAGFADLAGRVQGVSVRWRSLVLGSVAVLATYGVVANVSIGVVDARRTGRGEHLEHLVSLQRSISGFTGNPLRSMVHEVEVLPRSAGADELFVVGDCDALYVATGETASPWTPVQVRDQSFHIRIDDRGVRPGSLRLLWFSGYTLRRVHLQVGLDGQTRLVVFGAPPEQGGAWLDVGAGDDLIVTMRGDTAHNRYVVTATSGAQSSTVGIPMSEWDQQFHSVPITSAVAVGSPEAAASMGVSIAQVAGVVPDLCDRLRR